MNTQTYDISDGATFAETLENLYAMGFILKQISVEKQDIVNGLNPPTATCTFEKTND